MESIDDLRRSRARWRIAFGVAAAFALLVMIAAAYVVVDQGVTLTHQQVSFSDVERELEIARKIMPVLRRGDSRADVLALLREQRPDALIVATDSTVEIEGLIFRFGSDGRLAAVDRLND